MFGIVGAVWAVSSALGPGKQCFYQRGNFELTITFSPRWNFHSETQLEMELLDQPYVETKETGFVC